MRTDRQSSWIDRFLALLLTTIISVLALQALIAMLTPWLPLLGLAIVVAGGLSLVSATRQRW